jgi:hypothetical protein
MATKGVTEKDREFLIKYFKSKIQEHVTYWLGLSVLFFTAEQAFLGQESEVFPFLTNTKLFYIFTILFIGATCFIVGRICYWETFLDILFKITRIKNDILSKIEIIRKIHEMIEVPKDTNIILTSRGMVGQIFIRIDSSLYILLFCFGIILGIICPFYYTYFIGALLSGLGFIFLMYRARLNFIYKHFQRKTNNNIDL